MPAVLDQPARVRSTKEATVVEVDVKLEAVLAPNPGSELKCMVEPAPRVEVFDSVPMPDVPRSAGRRVVSLRALRIGRGTISAKSWPIMRMPNSISRERFKDSSVRSADCRAAR